MNERTNEMCACVFVLVYVRGCHTSVYVYVCMCVCVVCVYVYVHMCVCTRVYMCVCVCVFTKHRLRERHMTRYLESRPSTDSVIYNTSRKTASTDLTTNICLLSQLSERNRLLAAILLNKI